MTPTVACPNCNEPVIPGAQFCPRCGGDVSGPQGVLTTARVQTPPAVTRDTFAELVGVLREATLGEYDIIGELGRGGMAVVYLAHDIALDRKVAIKVMNPALLIGEGMTERFKREARTAAALTHPNIIPIHVVRETERMLFFVMKYVEGRSLDSIIAETGQLPIKMVHTILAQVGAALGYAHRRGVVHRDVKPANILIDTEGWVVVTDFGIAKVAEAGNLTVSGTTVGTPFYMSPEQCSARPVTGASDQYSLGIVAFEMLVGRPPFAGDSLMEIMRLHFFEAPPSLKVERPDAPPALIAAIERMLSKESRQRWPSIDEAIAAAGSQPLGHGDPIRARLSELAKSGVKPVARMSTPASPAPLRRKTKVVTKRRRGPLVWGAIVAGVVVAAAGAYWAVHPRPSEPSRAATRPSPQDSIVTVEIIGAPATLEEGQQVQLTASAKAASGTPIGSVALQWSSADSSVARVAADGKLTAVSAGTTTVEAVANRRRSSVRITVTAAAVASIDVAPLDLLLAIQGTARVSATPKDARGRQLLGRRIAWTSRDRGVATVSDSGIVTGVAVGTTTLTASVGGRNAVVRVTVAPPSVAAVDVSPRAPTIQIGDTLRVSAIARDGGGRTIGGQRVTWVSSNPAVAPISAEGRITGVAAGAATITALVGGRSKDVVVSVRAPAVASIQIAPATTSMIVGGSARLAAVPRDARGRALAVPVGWSSRDRGIASVSDSGVVTGIAPGSATIVAASQGVTATASVTVAPAPPAMAVLRLVLGVWADVTLDGHSLGQHTTIREPVTAGVTHRLRLERDGYVTVDTTVTLAAGDSTQRAMQLRPVGPAILRLLVVGMWANVTIDGIDAGQRSGFTDTLAAGSHRFRFEHDGFQTIDTTVTLQPGPNNLRIQFVKRGTP